MDPRPVTLPVRPSLRRYAVLSIAAAITTIALKGGAYLLTGSVGLLSDALESMVNLVAAVVALIALSIAARPADEEHAYGHDKAEYFASGFEGALILAGALAIVVTAVPRLIAPQPIEAVWLGLGLTVLASAINFVVARLLLHAGRRYDSITLEADAQHLMTDVLTSGAVVVGVAATAFTGWLRLDPLLALAVAARVFLLGIDLLRRSFLGLLDTSLPETIRAEILRILAEHEPQGVHHHALRTRQAGARRFVSVHILVPGHWSVQRGHDLLEHIEEEIRAVVPNSTVFTHLEPAEDPVSWQDTLLEREGKG
jgi:cation diffusion facilitator family transporter